MVKCLYVGREERAASRVRPSSRKDVGSNRGACKPCCSRGVDKIRVASHWADKQQESLGYTRSVKEEYKETETSIPLNVALRASG